MRQIFGILGVICIASLLQGNTNAPDTLIIDSKILDETWTFILFYPDNHPGEPVDIVYMPDGEWAEPRFSLRDIEQAPAPLIGVGIINTNKNRDMLPLKEAEAFLSFIEHELIPMAEKDMKVRERILFGHSFAGGFTINAMLMRPGLFDKYIASSPNLS